MSSIKSRFTIMLAIVVLSLGALLFTINSALQQTHALQTTIELSQNIQIHILELRKHEKDFIMRKNMKYVDKFKTVFNETQQLMEQLNKNLLNLNHPSTQLETLTPFVNQYQQHFLALAKLQQTIGLHSKDGLYGVLRSAVHQAESLLKQSKQIQLTADMLMLRRNEKDFMLRFAEKYQAKFIKNYDKFQTNLSLSDLNETQKQTITTAMKQYKTGFLALIDAEKTKGLDEKSGIQGKMRSSVHSIKEPLQQLKASVQLTTQQVKDEINNMLWSIATLSFFAVLAVISLTTRKVLKGVAALIYGMKRTQDSGDFSQKIVYTANDEFGRIANSYNGLLSTVSQQINNINGILDSIAKGDFKQRINEEFTGDFEQLRTHLNRSVSSVDTTMNALKEIMTALETGQFDVRMNQAVQGDLKAKVDHSMSFLESAVNEIQSVMVHVSQGEFDKRIQSQLPGQLASLKSSINNSVNEVDRAFSEIADYANALAANDLTHSIQGQFEGRVQQVQNDLNNAIKNLSNAISAVDKTAMEVEKGANLISETNSSLSQRIQEEASSLEQTAAAIEQMTSSVMQSTENSQQASRLSHTTKGEAIKGEEVMQSTIHSMHEIQDSSNKIEEIVTLIDSIAFQTNLLALNAAVEAARAGEQGRGFAVVAGEVRSLAGKSSDAAKDIKVLIEEISSKVANGSRLAEQSGEAFSTITASIESVVNIVEEISTAGNEQAKGISEVNQAMASMDAIAQKNASMVESSATNSMELKHDAELLKHLVDKFKITKLTTQIKNDLKSEQRLENPKL